MVRRPTPTRTRSRAALLAALTALPLGSAAGVLLPTFAGAAPLHGGGCSPDGGLVTKQAVSKSFTFTLVVNPVEPMVMSAAEAKQKQLPDAELMVAGSMETPKGATNHLEVHICGLTSRKLVPSPVPSIALSDLTGGSSLAGHRYRVTVRLKGEAATLLFTGPAAAKATADATALNG